MTDILERLKAYNPPDRTIDSQRQFSVDLRDARSEIEKLRTALEQICYVEGVNPTVYKIAMTALKD